MYAIVKVGGRQYRVESGDSIVVDRLSAKEGDKVNLEPLLFRPDGNKAAVFEGADLEKVKVEATVAGHERGPKLHVLKFKPKRGYKRRTGHRSDLTRLQIGEIKQLSRRPAAAAKDADAGAGAIKAAATKEAPKPRRAPARKPAAKKPAGEAKAAAKKPAAKKPAAKKPAARKPAARKKEDGGGS
jgi:large subunit ribosomal protein L21